MKRVIACALALMLLAGGTALANEYVNEAYAVFVENIAFIEDKDGVRQVELKLPNMGQEPIEAVAVDFVMLGADGEPVLGYSADMEGFIKELRGGTYDDPLVFDTPLQPGAVSTYTQSIWAEYADAVQVRAAVTYYRRTDGTEFFIAPEAMLWNTTDGTRLDPAPGGKYYPAVSEEESALASSFALGIVTSARLLQDRMAAAYGMPRGGQWVMDVGEDSLGSQLGLEPGDLILSAAGFRAADDYAAISRAKAKMAAGETVEYVWMRGSETLRGTLTAPAK